MAGPMAGSSEGGVPIRIDEAIRAASSQGPPLMYSMRPESQQQTSVDTNLLLLRILEQMAPGQQLMTRGGRS